jgi:hypothetical protein
MLRRYSVNFVLFSILLDVICILTALFLAYYLHPWLEIILPVNVASMKCCLHYT